MPSTGRIPAAAAAGWLLTGIDGIPISRWQVRNLMRRMGLRAIYQNPRTTVPDDPSKASPVWWISAW
jgi:hypothetical protein